MKIINQAILGILHHPLLIRPALNYALKLHNYSYQLAGLLSTFIEPDRLHPKHRLMNYHEWFASKLEKSWDVLDIGCGNGALARDIRSSCRSVTGIDISEKNIETARTAYHAPGIRYICADVLTYEFEDHFHAIVLSNVLEHIDNRVKFLKGIFSSQDQANPPILLLRVPMITRDWITLYKKERGIEWRLDTTHFTEYTCGQIFDETRKAGLSVVSYQIDFGEFYGVFERRI